MSTTPAAIAERLTGKPWGPVSGRRGASRSNFRKGHTVWPTVSRVTNPDAPATRERKIRRSMVAASAVRAGGDDRESACRVVVNLAPMWTINAPMVIHATQ